MTLVYTHHFRKEGFRVFSLKIKFAHTRWHEQLLFPEVVTARAEGGMTMEEIVIKVDLKKLKKLIKQAEEQADQLQKTLDEINEIRNLIS